MPKNYSTKFVEAIQSAEGETLGVELAKICVEANIPPRFIAKHFSVTRITIHSWFRGGAIKESKKLKIVKFIEQLYEDLKKGDLPAKDGKSAKEYIERFQ